MGSDQPILMKMAGTGQAATGSHNDLLRALLATGIIGLLIYLSLLAYQWSAQGFIGLPLQGSIDADRDAMDLDKKPVKDGIRGFIGLQSGNLCV